MGLQPPPPPPAAHGEAPPPPDAGGSVATRRDRWTAGRIVALVAGIVVALISLGLFAAGGFTLWADLARRDAAGYVTSGEHRFASPTYAIVSKKIELHNVPSGLLGTVRLRVTPFHSTATRHFVGIGEASKVARYLRGVRYATVTDLYSDAGTSYRLHPGGAPPSAPIPAGTSVWAAASSGHGMQTVLWRIRPGSWVVVVMNEDASRGISVRADIGAEIPDLLWIAIGLLIAGAIFAGGSAFLLWFAFHTRRT